MFVGLGLSYCSAQTDEFVEKWFEIGFVVDVESIPKIIADDYASESQFARRADGIDIHPAKRINFAVYEPREAASSSWLIVNVDCWLGINLLLKMFCRNT